MLKTLFICLELIILVCSLYITYKMKDLLNWKIVVIISLIITTIVGYFIFKMWIS